MDITGFAFVTGGGECELPAAIPISPPYLHTC